MSDRNQVIEECQKVGEDEVRLRIKLDVYNRVKRTYAEEWLESQARLRSEASQSESLEIARSAKDAAWAAADAARDAATEARTANRIAKLAIIIAAIALAAPIFGPLLN